MEKREAMLSYIKPAKSLVVALLALTALFAGAAVSAAYFGSQKLPDAVPYTHEVKDGTYCYTDMQILSEWVYKITGDSNITYYEAADTSRDCWYIVTMRDDQYTALQPLVDFTYNSTLDLGDPGAPAPRRLYGVVQDLPAETLQALADCYRYTPDEYEAIFGRTCLNLKLRQSNAAESWSIFLAVVFFIALLLVWAVYHGVARAQQKCVRRLESLGLSEQAESEFGAENNTVYKKSGLILSENFLYAKNRGLALPYTDAAWLYKRVQRYYFVSVATTLHVKTLSGISAALATRNVTDAFIDEIRGRIAKKNPDVLLGYTFANRKLYRTRCADARRNP